MGSEASPRSVPSAAGLASNAGKLLPRQRSMWDAKGETLPEAREPMSLTALLESEFSHSHDAAVDHYAKKYGNRGPELKSTAVFYCLRFQHEHAARTGAYPPACEWHRIILAKMSREAVRGPTGTAQPGGDIEPKDAPAADQPRATDSWHTGSRPTEVQYDQLMDPRTDPRIGGIPDEVDRRLSTQNIVGLARTLFGARSSVVLEALDAYAIDDRKSWTEIESTAAWHGGSAAALAVDAVCMVAHMWADDPYSRDSSDFHDLAVRYVEAKKRAEDRGDPRLLQAYFAWYLGATRPRALAAAGIPPDERSLDDLAKFSETLVKAVVRNSMENEELAERVHG